MVIVVNLLYVIIVALFAMALAYLSATKLNFYSLVDCVWSFCFAAIAVLFAVSSSNFDQHFVFYAIVFVWSIRLGGFILARLVTEYPSEDRRYTALKARWGDEASKKFGLFFAAQGATIVLLSLPLVLVASNPNGQVDYLGKVAVMLWLIGVIGEAIADLQLQAFKKDPHNSGQVCDAGLWKFSRHPNYFFEWIIWVAFSVYALGSPYGYLGLAAPLFMFYLLNFVSGIPLAEAQSLKSKGDLYKEYQRRTSKFFPWIPKKEI